MSIDELDKPLLLILLRLPNTTSNAKTKKNFRKLRKNILLFERKLLNNQFMRLTFFSYIYVYVYVKFIIYMYICTHCAKDPQVPIFTTLNNVMVILTKFNTFVISLWLFSVPTRFELFWWTERLCFSVQSFFSQVSKVLASFGPATISLLLDFLEWLTFFWK